VDAEDDAEKDAEQIAAVVLTGGQAARLGGADKASIELGGRTLLEHSLAALTDVAEVVVVGAEVPTTRPVTFTREEPADGGPAAGLLAGLRCFAHQPRWVVVLAVDTPLVTPDTVRRLLGAARDDGAVLVDETGRKQYLCAAYSVGALDRVRPSYEQEHGLAMRALVADLALEQVPAVGAETRDVDTWDDLAELRETFGA
jgi:molybdopterin-guanine dinucleotide biosynthesis protein A